MTPAKTGFQPGEAHPNWKGDDFKGENTGRARAQRMYPELGICELCRARPARDRDHKDGDTRNNAPENIQRLCRSCHNKKHGRRFPVGAPKGGRPPGGIPWNKGLTKALDPRCRGGRRMAA